MANDKVKEALNERFLLQKEYLGDAKPVNLIQPLVSVTVATYQHVNYIKECLDGILMQEVTFPYEIILGEDGSVDGTQEICKEYAEKYPDKIRLFIRDRKLSQYVGEDGKVTRFNGIWNRMSARGKYIAWCEGDDYWIDPLKLQKQVNYLEKHPECGIVRTNVSRYFQAKNELEKDFFSRKMGLKMKDTFEDYLLKAWFAAPCTWVYRAQYLNCVPFWGDKNYFNGDIVLLLTILRQSQMKYISDTTAVYRVLDSSASHFENIEKVYRFWVTIKNSRLFFAKNVNNWLKWRLWLNCCMMSLYFSLRINKWRVYKEWIPMIWVDLCYLYIENYAKVEY